MPLNHMHINDMRPNGKRADRRDMLLCSAIVALGLCMSGLSLSQIGNQVGNFHPQMAQATPPLRSTPGAETMPSAPASPATTGSGTRPSEIPPQPARPDAEAQKAGATPALPPAPAEKIAPPITAK